jgi:hypothetical protein
MRPGQVGQVATCLEQGHIGSNYDTEHNSLLKVLYAFPPTSSVLVFLTFSQHLVHSRPPLWSSGQNSWLQIQRPRVRFSALPDFMRSSGSVTGRTQPREDN